MSYQFTVDPNYSGKNLPGWYLMNTYLQRRLGLPLRFTPFSTFDEARAAVMAGDFDLVYANPFDAVQYIQRLGFQSLAKPAEHFDEVLLASNADGGLRDYADLPAEIRVASASDKTLIHMVGLFLLDKAEIDRARLRFEYTGSYQGVIKALIQGKADVGFVFNEVYDAASDVIRRRLHAIDRSEDAFAFHSFCISPRLGEHAEAIRSLLLGMQTDEAGARLLEDIGFKGFEAVSQEEIECLSTLAEEYVSGHEAIDLASTSSIALDASAFVIAREDEAV